MKCHKEKYSWIKMDNHTVVQLRAIAKERSIRSYYKLRKAELIHALEAARLVEPKSNIFDESIPNIPLQFYNQHREDHQISRRKLSEIKKNHYYGYAKD